MINHAIAFIISGAAGAGVDVNQLFQTFFSNLPATIAAVVAAMLAWHNRTISRETRAVAKETKIMVNGRMDQLLEAARELAELRGRAAHALEISEVNNDGGAKKDS